MPDWDEDSPRLRKNLAAILDRLFLESPLRKLPALNDARMWHRQMMDGLTIPDPIFAGAFRGETGLERVNVQIGVNFGVHVDRVSEELNLFERDLRNLIAELDALILPTATASGLDGDQMGAVLDLCAWVHAEWVRIHPFANGNGRTARIWANFLAMRYGLPPFIRLRPRPAIDAYAMASAQAMQGDWVPTAAVFQRLLYDFIEDQKDVTIEVLGE